MKLSTQKFAALTAVGVMALSASAAEARHGADDPAGHKRHGADDVQPHFKRGADDSRAHKHRHHGRGRDDGPNHR
jgi:hypothetical protein